LIAEPGFPGRLKAVSPESQQSRDVHLSVPARPDYLVLARLALSAMCRLTPLEQTEVADLKLAVTEATASFVADGAAPDAVVEFDFRLLDDRIEMRLGGTPVETPSEELEVSRAIVAATVDEFELDDGRASLVKRFS
jgi:anti-sigma regulatory factor (Ser/Thr protein kinase)